MENEKGVTNVDGHMDRQTVDTHSEYSVNLDSDSQYKLPTCRRRETDRSSGNLLSAGFQDLINIFKALKISTFTRVSTLCVCEYKL